MAEQTPLHKRHDQADGGGAGCSWDFSFMVLAMLMATLALPTGITMPAQDTEPGL